MELGNNCSVYSAYTMYTGHENIFPNKCVSMLFVTSIFQQENLGFNCLTVWYNDCI